MGHPIANRWLTNSVRHVIERHNSRNRVAALAAVHRFLPGPELLEIRPFAAARMARWSGSFALVCTVLRLGNLGGTMQVFDARATPAIIDWSSSRPRRDGLRCQSSLSRRIEWRSCPETRQSTRGESVADSVRANRRCRAKAQTHVQQFRKSTTPL